MASQVLWGASRVEDSWYLTAMFPIIMKLHVVSFANFPSVDSLSPFSLYNTFFNPEFPNLLALRTSGGGEKGWFHVSGEQMHMHSSVCTRSELLSYYSCKWSVHAPYCSHKWGCMCMFAPFTIRFQTAQRPVVGHSLAVGAPTLIIFPQELILFI